MPVGWTCIVKAMGRGCWRGVIAAVLAGCGFNPPAAGGDGGSRSDVGLSDSSGSDGKQQLDGAVDAAVPFCDHNDSSLVACYELEGTTVDGSVNRLDADIIINASYGTGKVGQALIVGDTTEVD